MKRILSAVIIAVLLISANLSVYAQSDLDNIILKLKTYNKVRPAEKSYLHFDKPYYAAGDTVYFKAYVTMGERHDLSKISGVLHVDFINTVSKADQSIKLQLINGVAWGDFTLPDSLPAGNYRIRAYTQWMRNWGDNSYFEKVIPIGTLHQKKISESNAARIKPSLNKADLQFFPEGGSLITGISTKVAFKAVGNNGMGMAVSGEVTDNMGKEIVSFRSEHMGMGYFWLKPEERKSYKASVTYADGTRDILLLPVESTKGITLSINNDSLASAAVRIEANPVYFDENKGKNYNLLIYSGGYVTTVSCKLDSPVIKMAIIKRRLFTGITTVTLFSNEEPLCERLLFAQNYDQLNLDVSADKTSYAPKEKVNIKLNARNRADSVVAGHFSVSVTDEQKVPVDEITETTILTDLLLTSDLKGYVEQPNYYFTGNADEKLRELDLVMLTQGYRRFEWKQVLNDNGNTIIAYAPERSLAISGTAKNLLGTPLSKATVSLISVESRHFISDVTDNKGHFSFGNLIFVDTARFVLQAVNARGKNNTQLTYDMENPPPINPAPAVIQNSNADTLMTAYLQNNEKQQEELNKLGLGKGRMLKEVKIRGIKEDNNYPSSSLLGPGHADQVVHREELEKTGGPLSTKLAGKFHGSYGWAITAYGKFGGLIIVDGVHERPPFNIDNINGNDVETVELLYGANASIYGEEAGIGGVLVITTRQGEGLKVSDIASIGILPITAKGFYKAREFYSPKYEHPADHAGKKDLRSTIYWQPELVTDKDGNASFNYYNADGTGSYRVVIEGIDEKGNIGRRVYRYQVE